tara:strand:- start:695 stop:1000 length:306 start_codon:yes stop_codon:yes gene_type:complete
LRKLPKDIIDEMKARFNSDFDSANKILTEYIAQNEYLNSDRIIRCIVYLADNGIESFKSYLDCAKGDPRDVMYWAECDGDFKNHNVKQIRDFNKTFEENDI